MSYFRIMMLLCLMSCNLKLSSQATFQNTYGTELDDYGAGIIELPDGNFLILAQASFTRNEQTKTTDDDIILLILNSLGDIQSSTRYSLPGDQEPVFIFRTLDGGFMIGGSDYGGSNQRSFLLKLNNDLSIAWSKLISTSVKIRINFLREDSSGNIYFGADCWVGNFPDLLVIKMDSGGNELWRRTWGLENNDHIYDIHFNDDGKIYIFTCFWYSAAELVVICLDSNGQSIWEKSFFSDHNYYPRSFVSLENGEIVLFGRTAFDNNSFAIRFDADFNPVWSKLITIGSELFIPEAGVYNNGTIYLFGNFTANSQDIALLSMNAGGNINWMKGYGGEAADYTKILFKNTITKTEDGLLFVSSTESFGSGMSDIYLIKTDFDGNSGCNEYEVVPAITNLQYAPRDVSIAKTFNATQGNVSFSSQPFEGFEVTQLCFDGLQADFTSDKQVACVFETVNFIDLSEGNPVSWFWIFEGGNPSTSQQQHPENIQYDTPGNYDVTLIVSDGSSQDTLVKEDFIQIFPNPDISIGQDTILCSGQVLLLEPGNGFETYLWQDGSEEETFTVTETGLYWVEVTNVAGCIKRDSIFVNFLQGPEIWLGNDSTLCSGDTVLICVDPDYQEYLWQDGSTESCYVAIESGAYWVRVTDENGCEALDTINLIFLPGPDLSLGNDTMICFNQSIILDAGWGYDNYLWQDGSSEQMLEVFESGTYWVVASNQCGTGSDTIQISFSEYFEISLGDDTSFCYGQSIVLDPGGGFTSYLWQNGSAMQTLTASTTGHYWVAVTDSVGCVATDSIYIDVFMDHQISIGDDTVKICEGSYIFFHGPPGYVSYLWQDGSVLPSLFADTAGVYWLEVTDEQGCAARDSVLLQINSIPDGFLGDDLVICPGSEITITAPSNYESYVWHDGSGTNEFITNTPGKFWVTVQDEIGCTGSDTIIILPFHPPTMNLEPLEYLCEGDSLILTAGEGHLSYMWQDGSQNSFLRVEHEGMYHVVVETVCGDYADTVQVVLYHGNLDLGNDTVLFGGESLFLYPGSAYSNHNWNTGSTDSTLFVDQEGTYWLNAFDGYCYVYDTITIHYYSDIWVPNVFTPNDDGYNDTFYAVTSYPDGIFDFRMTIFNRWGKILITMDSIYDQWDGTVNGSNAADGVYFWVCEYTTFDSSDSKVRRIQRGSVTLLR